MKITLIGSGNMGGALLKGLIKSQKVNPADVTVSDINLESLAKMQDLYPEIHTTSDNKQAVTGANIVILAVKPWLVKVVMEPIAESIGKAVLISLAAGVTIDILRGYAPNAAIFRVIPNIAAEYLCSMSFVAVANASDEQKQVAFGLLGSVGNVLEIAETQFAAATALSSCGIAFAMKYIRASMIGGITIGFSPKVAEEIVLQTVKGAVNLLEGSGNNPEVEIDKVSTPGGLTIKGLNAMDENGFTHAVLAGILEAK